MLYRTFCTLFLAVLSASILTSCDNRPKVIMPTEKAPPAPRPRVAGGGPRKPGPEAESREKLPMPKEQPPDETPP
jgi:hypothetical protein